MFDKTTAWTSLGQAENHGGRPVLLAILYGNFIENYLKREFKFLTQTEIDDILAGMYEDLLNEKLNPKREKGRLRGLIATYFSNRVNDYLKKQYREEEVKSDLRHIFMAYIDEEENKERVEQLENLNDAIYSLTEAYSEVIRLHYFESLSCKEIATRLNLESATVRKRLERGREKIAEFFESHT